MSGHAHDEARSDAAIVREALVIANDANGCWYDRPISALDRLLARLTVAAEVSGGTTETAPSEALARLRAELGEAEELLGECGAGGTPAGLIGGIHNLVHRAEEAERSVGLLEEALCGLLVHIEASPNLMARINFDLFRAAKAALAGVETGPGKNHPVGCDCLRCDPDPPIGEEVAVDG